MEGDCLCRGPGTNGYCCNTPLCLFTLRRNCRCLFAVSLDYPNIWNVILILYSKNDAPNSVEPHRGFGYVEFEDPEDIKEAIDNMDQSELFGKVIKVSAAKPPKNVNEGLGSKTALWEQVCSLSFPTVWLCIRRQMLIQDLRRVG